MGTAVYSPTRNRELTGHTLASTYTCSSHSDRLHGTVIISLDDSVLLHALILPPATFSRRFEIKLEHGDVDRTTIKGHNVYTLNFWYMWLCIARY
jgi:hypothetical protein